MICDDPAARDHHGRPFAAQTASRVVACRGREDEDQQKVAEGRFLIVVVHHFCCGRELSRCCSGSSSPAAPSFTPLHSSLDSLLALRGRTVYLDVVENPDVHRYKYIS